MMLSSRSAAIVPPNMPDEQPRRSNIATPGDVLAEDSYFARDLALIDELEAEARAKWSDAPAAEAKDWTITLSRLAYWRRSVQRARDKVTKDLSPTRYPAEGTPAAEYQEQAVASRGAAQAARLRALAGQDQPEPE